MERSLRIAIAACEPSGDVLGEHLINALHQKQPGIEFFGVAGAAMRRAGCKALLQSEQLSVMGLFEIIRRLPGLIRLRRYLVREILRQPPDLFIGIDSPDFNLGVEEKLKQAGVPVVHYVSPSVWAWREGRVKRIARSIDLMLTLFPFEQEFYRRHQIAVEYIGHPLADTIPETVERGTARQRLGLDQDRPCIALLPGSRIGEVTRLLPVYLKTIRLCLQQQPALQFVLPMATRELEACICEQAAGIKQLRLIAGEAQRALAAADVALVASGTATLECLLSKCPMIVAYRMHPLSFYYANRLLRVPYVSLPNHLAGEYLVPEFIQHQATAENLYGAVWQLLNDPAMRRAQTDRFHTLHRVLKQSASQRAAERILQQWRQHGET